MNRTVGAILGSLAIFGSSAASAATLHPPEFFQKLIEKARLIAYDANALLRKPNPRPPEAFCRTASTCARYCSGANAIASMVHETLKKKGREVPALVDPAVAVQEDLRRLGCQPAGGDDLKRASENCGIRFLWGRDIRKVMPGVVPGLVRAAIEAGARGYVLLVGSTYRDEVEQTRKVCRKIASGASDACGDAIACPGGSKHGSGYAADVGLIRGRQKVTPMLGKAKSCESRKARVLADPHLRALSDIMLSTGWWWYCRELWHFEYSIAPNDPTRVSSLEDVGRARAAKTTKGQGKTERKDEPEGLLEKAKQKVGEWAEGAADKVKGWAGGLLGSRGYIAASSAWMRAGPSKNADRIRLLRRCDEVRVLGKKHGWVEIESGGGRGFAYQKYVSTERPERCR